MNGCKFQVLYSQKNETKMHQFMLLLTKCAKFIVLYKFAKEMPYEIQSTSVPYANIMKVIFSMYLYLLTLLVKQIMIGQGYQMKLLLN
jgi:hypothetical protein